MRFVDNTFIDLTDGWDDRAEASTQDLINGNFVADDRSAIWKELKESLELLSNGRCWYCETNIPRTDNAVDHYRPKGIVKGVSIDEAGKNITRYDIAPAHSGYKWAAFKEENFRFSCQHCNEFRKDLQGTAGGKWNYFPLIEEAERAYIELDEDNENPSLLDPCKRLDWRMLSYDKSGAPFSRYAEGSEEDSNALILIQNDNKERALEYYFGDSNISSGRGSRVRLNKTAYNQGKKVGERTSIHSGINRDESNKKFYLK